MIHPIPDHPLPEPLQKLQEAYPGWSIWQSKPSAAYCFATRLKQLTPEEIKANLARTIDSDTPDGLREGLREQVERAAALTTARSTS
ncbi:hypothetical protein ACIBG7_43045 [Nonomuraea sp. NPDC050328]|uniref:hypothetical protein n=1 Tax=Nonomuraea sp. NPDC050328 TaxID=3364361 RepID=UPI0037A37388